MRVVPLILDSMPHRMISREATPHLWAQVHAGGRRPVSTGGNHGSAPCRTQMAIISGGHLSVEKLAKQIEQDWPGTLTWAPLISELLDLEEAR